MFLALFSFLVAFQQISAASYVQDFPSRQITFSNEADKENLPPTEVSTLPMLSVIRPSSVLPSMVETSQNATEDDQDKIADYESFERTFCFYRETAKKLKGIESKLDQDPENEALSDLHCHFCCLLFNLTSDILKTHGSDGLEYLKEQFEIQARLTQSKLENYGRTQYKRRKTLDLSRVARVNDLNVKTVHVLNFILHLQHWLKIITVFGTEEFHEQWEPFLL
jgi:hypothetical protein